MNWYYEAAGQQQGPISDSELDRLLAEGKITPDTLVWREGLPAWTPLRTTRAASDGSAEVAGAGAAPADVPAGYIRCTLTGKYFPPSEIIYIEGRPYSAEAKPQVLQSLQAGGALPGTDIGRAGPAWEQRHQLGFLRAIWETVKSVLTEPAHAFATMRREGGLGGPLLFLVLTAGLGAMVNQLISMLIQGAAFGAIGAMPQPGGGAGQPNPFALNAALGMNMAMQIAIAVAMPVFMIVSSFIYAGIVHLSLKVLGGANRPFETTMRAVCYSSGAGGVLAWIPVCGGMIGGIWGMVALCIGLGRAHDTTPGKGVAAVLLPIAVCCIGYAGLMVLMIGGMAAAGAASGR